MYTSNRGAEMLKEALKSVTPDDVLRYRQKQIEMRNNKRPTNPERGTTD